MNAHPLPSALAPSVSASLLQRTGGAPLAEQLAALFAGRIAQRSLAAGARLPSVRDCARQHQVSPSTVVAAYDQLQAKGLIEARKQRGFYVREPALVRGGAPAGLLTNTVRPLAAPVDATALIRGMFSANAGRMGPGLGTVPQTWLDASLLERAIRRVLSKATDATRYGDPAGDPGLRRALSRRLSTELGVAATPEQIVTTVGATHALDLIARTLLLPGDAVLVDEPGWAVEFARLTRMGMRLLPVPRGPDGPDLAVMAQLLAEHRPRLYMTVSVLHNPTGQSLSLASAHQILTLAQAHDLTIVEDDTFAWLAPPHLPRLSALDGLKRTIYVSGFSKVLSPDWRVGFAAAAPAMIDRLIDTKMLTTLTTPSLQEQAVAWCLDQGLMRRHSERLSAQLDSARQRVARLAENAGCRFLVPPQGLFGWADTGVDTDELASRMAQQGWLLAPGGLFHAKPKPSTLMRINFASAQDARFWHQFRSAREKLLSEG